MARITDIGEEWVAVAALPANEIWQCISGSVLITAETIRRDSQREHYGH